MKLGLTWGELAAACEGKLAGPAETRLDSISTDTRALKPDQAFWALKGEIHDAHDFLGSARRCEGWIVRSGRPLPADRPEHVLEVGNTLKALHALARYHRRRFDIPIAAIAGSNGKTTTKQMLRAICETQGPVCATQGNFNNQFGLPFSVLELSAEHHFGVFELGESHPGDIDELTRILEPTVGVLTNVGPAHLEFFGDLQGVFQCLCELPKAAPKARVAIHLDDPYLSRLRRTLGDRLIGYGRGPEAEVRVDDGKPGQELLCLPGRALSFSEWPRLHGKIQRTNAAAAAAGAIGLGLDGKAIAQGLAAFEPAPMRFERRVHSSGATLIVDTYNANPGSMRAGIESFCEAFPRERRIVVLGDMKELGGESSRYHREIVQWAASLPLEALFLAGKEMAAAANGTKPQVDIHAAEEPSGWLDILRHKLKPGVAVYLKASRAMRFENILEKL